MLFKRSLLCFLLPALLSAPMAHAGTNEGYTFSVSPESIVEPQIGSTFEVTIDVQGATEAKGTQIIAQYDPAVFSLKDFVPGDLIPGMIILPPLVSTDENGLNTVKAGGTQLIGSPGSGDGTLGTVVFEVTGELPVAGSHISILELEINASAQDKDIQTFAAGERGVRISRNFTNRIFDLTINRVHNRAAFRWRTLFPGINDRVRYRVAGSDDPYLSAVNPLLDEITEEQLSVLAALRELGTSLNDDETLGEALRELGFEELPSGFIATLREINAQVNRIEHLVVLTGLEPGTSYEFEAVSIGLDGDVSAPTTGTFRTRSQIDDRPLTVTRFDSQTTATSATFRWETNRDSDTRVVITIEGTTDVRSRLLDTEGTTSHIVNFTNLQPDTRYLLAASSRLVGVDDLIEAGLLTEEQATVTRTGSFRTQARILPVRFTARPKSVVGPTNATVLFALDRIATVRVDYGPVANSSAKVTQQTQVQDDVLYPSVVFSTEVINKHLVSIEDLDPTTEYRYRITATTPDGQVITTDPRGNEQWSRDLRFTTSDAADTDLPVIIAGPQVQARGQAAVIRFITDRPTTARLAYGTLGENGTLGTPDEFEKIDVGADGFARISRQHRIAITGLDLGTDYGYRLEYTGPNGQTAVFDPLGASAAAKILQPPGGAGGFKTRNQVDTQFPVILTGPTVTGKTHNTAIIEWTTDEPASSQARFTLLDSANAEEEIVFDGDTETTHKLVLSNLSPGLSYNYFVGSTDIVGNGITESVQAVLTTNAEVDLDPPVITQAPEVVYKNDKRATIAWETDEDADGQVAYGTSADDLSFIRSELSSSQEHQLTLTNLQPATEYFFQVSSTDLSNNGPSQSQILSFTTDPAPDVDSPQISNVTVTTFRNRAIVRWNTNEIADSFVDFGEGGSSLVAAKASARDRVSAFFQEGGTLDQSAGDIEDVAEHEIVLTNLEPGTSYFYTVGSTDPADNPFTESEVLLFETLVDEDSTPPAAPLGLAAAAGVKQAVLTWSPNAEVDLGTYKLYRRVSGSDNDFAPIASGLVTTSYTDLGLTDGITYQYRLTALDLAPIPNESDPSATIEVIPSPAAAPSAPTDLSVGGDNFLRPLFSFDNATPINTGGALTYTLQVSTTQDFDDVTASVSGLAQGSGGIGTGKTGWTIDRDLIEGVAYFWRVRAIENGILGPFSDPVQFIAQEVAAITGDFNSDAQVGFDDFFLFVDFFGQIVADVPAALAFDLDGDGTIGFGDFFLFVDNFGFDASGKSWTTATATDPDALITLEATGGTRQSDGLITVKVRAEGIDDLKAFGLVLDYDPAAVELQQALPGPDHMLAGEGTEPLFHILSQSPGQVLLGGARTDGETASGQGLLAQFEFRVHGSLNDAVFDLRDALLARSGTDVRRVEQLRSTRLVPLDFHLGANFPNPFNPSTTIEYALPQDGPVSLHIYDILGRRIRTLVKDDNHPLGFYALKWDGRDAQGRNVASGVFFYRLSTPSFTKTQKMTLIK